MDILDRLEIGYKLVRLSGTALPALPASTRPLALVASPDVPFSAIEAAVASLGLRRTTTLLFLHLAPGDGTDDSPNPVPSLQHTRPRAACSGHLAPDGRLALANCDVAYLGADVLAAAKFRIVEDALLATQTAFGAEAAAMSTALGVRGDLFCRAVGTAAGSSWVLRNLVPVMLGLGGDGAAATAPGQTYDEAQQALATALDAGYKEDVSLPLASLAAQLFALAAPKADPHSSSAQVHRLWDVQHPEAAAAAVAAVAAAAAAAASDNPPLPDAVAPRKVAFAGLGAMGYGMANVLRGSGLDVVAYDAYLPTLERYKGEGGAVAASPAECAEDADVLVLMVVSAEQAADALFRDGAAAALAPDAVVLLMITSAPSDAVALATRLAAARPDVRLVDAPVSGSPPRAAVGDLTILAGGLEACLPAAGGRALHVLRLLSGGRGNARNLFAIAGGVGRGMAVKLLNQHQGAGFLLTSAETLALAKRLRLPLRDVRGLLLRGPAQTWMMWHRGGNMLRGLLTPPDAAIAILHKDVRICMLEARTRRVALPLLEVVQQAFVLGKANGWGGDDDSSLARLWLSSGIDLTTSV